MAKQPENSQKTATRAATAGSFKPGQSGNAGGRPKKTEEQFALERACEEKAPAALATILDLMDNARQDSVRLAAATYVIERRYGKPTERKEIKYGALDDLPVDELEAMDAAIEAIRLAQVAAPPRARQNAE